jgi:hypothetical protein
MPVAAVRDRHGGAGLAISAAGFLALTRWTRENRHAAENRTAIIYGAGGAVGGAVARALARDGAAVSLQTVLAR